MSAALRTLASRTAPILKPHITQKATIVSGPPKNRISFAEKAVTGSVMITAIIAPMGYIMSQIKVYKTRAGVEE